MITSLTPEQQQQVLAIRDRFFAAATSTVTDRAKAERAIATIVAPALQSYEVHWCSSPEEADKLRKQLFASPCSSLRDSLRDSLWASLWASLSDSLSDSLWASLWASLWDSLSDSLRTSLLDSGWLAFYVAPDEIGIIQYEQEDCARMRAFSEFLESAFALWVLPGHVIALEKPNRVAVTDGKLVDIRW